MNWDLTKLYSSFDDPKLEADLTGIFDDIAEANAFLDNAAPDKAGIEGVLARLEALTSKEMRFGLFIQMTLAVDATNKDALVRYDRLMRAEMERQKISSRAMRLAGGIEDLDALAKESEKIADSKFCLAEMMESYRHLIDPALEDTVLEMQMNGASAWEQLRDKLDAGLMIEVPGEEKKLPLSAVRGMAYLADAEKRRAAYEAEIAAYPQIETPMAACLNGIKGEALTMCKLRSYDSVLDWALFISRMDKETLDAMMTAMRESLPDFRRYFRLKAKALGYEGGLKFYDLFAPLGASEKTYTLEEAREKLVTVMGGFSDKMAKFIDNAFENRWIDAFPRQGKSGGAFCAGAHMIGQSFVMTNFDGSLSSVSTIAHELGHAYHNSCVQNETILNAEYPMPLAETASIFNETLLSRILLKDADENEKLALLDQSVSDAAQVIVDIMSRFLFEQEVVERRKDHQMSAAELKEIMLDAQDKTYGDGLDENCRHPYMWACKSHYYSKDVHFYNFPYAFGQLFGLGVYAKYAEMGDAFIPEYDKLLNLTGKANVVEVGRAAGIDVHDVNFWRSSLDVVRGQIEEMAKIIG